MKLILIVAVILIAGFAPAQTRREPLVGNVKDNSLAEGCGCYIKFRNTPEKADRYILFSSIEDDNTTAWMNIDGRDVKLKLEKIIGPFGTERERVGSRSILKYRAGDITVTGTYVDTKECAPNDENCESTQYSVTFVVKKGSKSQVVKAKGSCGC